MEDRGRRKRGRTEEKRCEGQPTDRLARRLSLGPQSSFLRLPQSSFLPPSSLLRPPSFPRSPTIPAIGAGGDRPATRALRSGGPAHRGSRRTTARIARVLAPGARPGAARRPARRHARRPPSRSAHQTRRRRRRCRCRAMWQTRKDAPAGSCELSANSSSERRANGASRVGCLLEPQLRVAGPAIGPPRADPPVRQSVEEQPGTPRSPHRFLDHVNGPGLSRCGTGVCGRQQTRGSSA